jgi:hypothetical protein
MTRDTAGQLPLGYRYRKAVSAPGGKYVGALEIDPAAADPVRHLFELVAIGTSVRGAARRLGMDERQARPIISRADVYAGNGELPALLDRRIAEGARALIEARRGRAPDTSRET